MLKKFLFFSLQVLTIKAFVVKLLNIRARISLDSFGWPEDLPGLKFLSPVLKLVFLCDVKFVNDADSLNRLLAIGMPFRAFMLFNRQKI
jgi:hypothetical protein